MQEAFDNAQTTVSFHESEIQDLESLLLQEKKELKSVQTELEVFCHSLTPLAMTYLAEHVGGLTSQTEYCSLVKVLAIPLTLTHKP